MRGDLLVSIIINCYNSEEYLRETIESVLAQTYDNYEVIFWDNCSTDSTADIILDYNNPRFRYFHSEVCTPLGEARGLAIKKARGDLLCFLDSDDVWLSEFLERGVKAFMTESGISAFYSNYDFWESNNRHPYNRTLKSGKHSFSLILKTYGIGMSGCIVNSSIIKERNIDFDKRFHLIEDLDFFLKVAAYGDFYYDEESLYLYRIHCTNSSKTMQNRWQEEYHMLYEDLYNKYVNIPSPLLKKEDLSRIKDLEMVWEMKKLKVQDRRKELLMLMLRNMKITMKKPALLLYALVGPELFDYLKTKLR